MNLRKHIPTQNSAGPRCPERAIALVITLLMLSVITFLTVAFLAMTSRDKDAATTTLDVDTARSMSDAALARAQAQIIAQMMTNNDILNYDYSASHNYINPNGYAAEPGYDPGNVNYDTLITNATPGSLNPQWASNIANLFYDPRPPVFIATNWNQTQPATDFRFWVDINRNGRFETNGSVQDILPNGSPNTGVFDPVNGEPEWIGVLKYPETNHSFMNPFIGRYAFMVLPIGKTLDWNFIHNYSKFKASSGSVGLPNMAEDAFTRDQGVGSWELNLAALINDISPVYQTNPIYAANPYVYVPSYSTINGGPGGGVFFDASQFLAFRYGYNAVTYPEDLAVALGIPNGSPLINNIDEYGTGENSTSLLSPQFDYVGSPPALNQWPGGYNSNMFYDVQDLFDTTKTGPYFASNLLWAGALLDTTNRYTFQRLLDCIGTSSTPEYGVYVYSNTPFTNSFLPIATNVAPPSMLRTKVNINYDNTAQIQAGPFTPYGGFTPMPTNLLLWTNNAIGFFTNAADLLLRSQVFTFTNYVTNAAGQFYIPINTPSNFTMATFGITNIPVYAATNPGITYNEQVHRMLQMAANIYAAAYPNTNNHPLIFRPQFSVTLSSGNVVSNIYITNFVQVTNNAYSQISLPSGFPSGFKDLTNTTILPNDNIWGVPWVVGAVKGLPEFNQYSYQYRVFYQRALHFIRYPNPANTNLYLTSRPKYTNQFYEMSVSNICGMDAWNPYTNTFICSSPNGMYVVASNYITVTVTNNYLLGININITNPAFTSIGSAWPGTLTGTPFQTFLQTNFISLPYSYFSEANQNFISLPYYSTSSNQTYLSGDKTQFITYPTHYWTVSVTNHLYYALFDGNPFSANANLLDFVNVGPFGSSFPITQFLQTNSADPFDYPNSTNANWWTVNPANDNGSGGIPNGALFQINACFNGNPTFTADITGIGKGDPATSGQFTTPTAMTPPLYNVIGPYANYVISNSLMACDPLVHYTLGDLTWPGYAQGYASNVWSSDNPFIPQPWSSSLGAETARYVDAALNFNNIVFQDPGMTSASRMMASDNWQFPTNLFPGVGWVGRVHRGTPWQTIYLKPDNITLGAGWSTPSLNSSAWVNSPFTYPTNDWSIVDLFTAVPNDNAARGLLSVNQTNAAAWAAVFAGVIAMTNTTGGTPILPSIDPTLGYGNNVYTLMDYTNGTAWGINQARMNPNYNTNGLFHKIGDILQAPTLTVNSPFLAGASFTNDEMVERIPQQTLSLLKLGMPQFVIYSWGQSLKPAAQSLYSTPIASATVENICTNYEITGEFMTRTVCHIVSDPGAVTPKIVVDSYNIEPGN